MKWLGGLAFVLLALAAVWLALAGRWGASRTRASPALIQVLDLAPRDLELGDRVVIAGRGFPSGRAARVVFRGTLYRPGERPRAGVEVASFAAVTGPERLELTFDETMQARFCATGDDLVHTTFEGDVDVAFAAATQGAPPTTATLSHVTLDARPGAAPSDAERDAEGARVLAWAGLRGSAGSSGFQVAQVRPGSHAEAAGIAPGDVMVTFDGVRVSSLGDLVPAPGVREATVGVRSSMWPGETTRHLTLEGFRRASLSLLLGAALIAFAAVGLVVLFAVPVPTGVGAFVQRIGARARARRVGLGHFMQAILPAAGPSAVVDALAWALLASMPFGPYWVAAHLDAGLLFVAAATALSAAALAADRSPWRAARGALHVAWQHVPAAIAVMSVVLATGSLRVHEIEHAQGSLPWGWLAFRSPASLLGLVLVLSCARIELDAHGPTEAGGRAASKPPRDGHEGDGDRLRALLEEDGFLGRIARGGGAGGPWLEAIDRGHRTVVAGLASTLFLGGWLLPGVTPAEQHAHPGLEVAGAAWLVAKTCAVLVGLAWLRQALPPGRLHASTRTTAVWMMPLAAGTLASAVGWEWWGPPHSTQLLVSGALVLAVALTGVALAQRIQRGSEARLSPFM